MMDTSLTSLSDRFRPFAEAFLWKCQHLGIPIVVVCTRRTDAEQSDCLARGVSWTTHSKHLTGDAIDVATRELMAMKNWGPGDPEWTRIGEIGESLGLVWGGRFHRPDWGHFEIKENP